MPEAQKKDIKTVFMNKIEFLRMEINKSPKTTQENTNKEYKEINKTVPNLKLKNRVNKKV